MSSNKATAPVAASKRKEPPSTSDGEEEEEDRLDWRMDPHESRSDWTIEVVVGEKTHGTYHVHQNILSVGPKRSEYFAHLFQNDNFAEQQTRLSRIRLELLAAKAFPAMLDYLYSLWNEELLTDEKSYSSALSGALF